MSMGWWLLHSHSKRSNNEITAGTGINSIWEKLDSAGTQKDIHTYIPKMPNTQTQSKPNPSPSINTQTPSNPDTDIANTIKMKEKSIADPSKREYSLSGQLIGLWCHKLHESYGDKGHGILIKGSFTNYMLLGCLAAFRAPRLFHFLIESVIGNTWGLIRRICGTYVLGWTGYKGIARKDNNWPRKPSNLFKVTDFNHVQVWKNIY